MNQQRYFMPNAQKKPEEVDIIIIGAGPAGLACSVALQQLNLKSLVLESGTNPGNSWLKMPNNLHLGPWISTQIDKCTSLVNLYKCPTAQEFSVYLQGFANKNRLDIRTNQKVVSIKRDGNFFILETSIAQSLRTPCVINATGYFGNPFYPEWVKKIPDSCDFLHYNDYKDPAFILSSNKKLKILIVGGGISAGELLLDLEKSKHEIFLSTRNKLRFDKPKWLQVLVSPLYFWLEDKFPKFSQFGSSKRYMAGGKTKRILKNKNLKKIGPILDIKNNLFHHNKGSERFDLVLFATGWKCNLTHLPSELLSDEGRPILHKFQSVSWPGFFFLGIDNQVSYRSRLIRGIRNDANVLARTILNYFVNKNDNASA
jgi:putative flavoprotein involved in K+ transport